MSGLRFGHSFDKLIIILYALLCGGDTKFKVPKAGNDDVFFLSKRVRFARRADIDAALQYDYQ